MSDAPEKRFYRVDEDSCVDYHFVAADLHEVLRHMADPGHGFDADKIAEHVEIRQLTAEQAATVRVRDDNDGADFTTLAGAPMGSVFHSEA